MTESPLALDIHIQLTLRGFRLDVQFQTGQELVVVFGPSGAGKSATLRAIAGLVRPDAGHIRAGSRTLFDSKRGINLPPQARRVGYVPQHYALFPHLSVVDNIAYGLSGRPRAERLARVQEMLDLMRLQELADHRPGELSGGQQQRVALARALITEPQLLLMDEPLAALDTPLREHLRAELRAVQTRFRIPTLLVTHDLAEAYSLAQQLVVVNAGRVIQSGPRDEVFRRPVSPDVARALGMVNILHGRVLGCDSNGLTVAWAGREIHIPGGDHSYGDSVTFGIRPEEIMFVRSDRPTRPGIQENILSGRIVADDAQGFDHSLAFAVDVPGNQPPVILCIRLPHPVYLRLGLAVGQQHRVSLKHSAIHVFPSRSTATAVKR
ncbi:MAG TPA: ABC transporter ATP-binding protein, partial [Anaerolineae bacterium]|nr:ABC transporter ATP-binding protein [Anaerolineae bacterium]